MLKMFREIYHSKIWKSIEKNSLYDSTNAAIGDESSKVEGCVQKWRTFEIGELLKNFGIVEPSIIAKSPSIT